MIDVTDKKEKLTIEEKERFGVLAKARDAIAAAANTHDVGVICYITKKEGREATTYLDKVSGQDITELMVYLAGLVPEEAKSFVFSKVLEAFAQTSGEDTGKEVA